MGAKPFPQRVLAHEHVQLAESLLVAGERDVAVDPFHQRGEPQLVELRHLITSARLELEPGERRATPQGERLLETLGSALELSPRDVLARTRQEELHAAPVDSVRVDAQPIAA